MFMFFFHLVNLPSFISSPQINSLNKKAKNSFLPFLLLLIWDLFQRKHEQKILASAELTCTKKNLPAEFDDELN